MSDPIYLDRCPFCLAPGRAVNNQADHHVECQGRFSTCPMNMRTYYCKTLEEAAALWNTRSSYELVTSRIRESKNEEN